MRIGVVANVGYAGLGESLRQLRETADALAVELSFDSDVRSQPGLGEGMAALEERRDEVDAILTLGGDGTLLRGARIAGPRGVPLLGCNMGRLGFLTAAPGSDLPEAMERLVDGSYQVQERMALRVGVVASEEAEGEGPSYYAVNDAVVHKSGYARLITLRIWIDGDEVGQYSADGIVLSTATGSTAYSLSAGGPILAPDLDALVATPICPHTLAARSLVLSGDRRIRVQALSGGEETVVTVDGQKGSRLNDGDLVEVRRDASPLRLVRFPERKFYTVLRHKLGWGDVRPREDRGDR